MVGNIHLDRLGHLSQLCPLHKSCSPSAYLLQSQNKKQRRPWHCANPTRQQLEYWWVINIVLVINLKHSPIWAAVKRTLSQPYPEKQSWPVLLCWWLPLVYLNYCTGNRLYHLLNQTLLYKLKISTLCVYLSVLQIFLRLPITCYAVD